MEKNTELGFDIRISARAYMKLAKPYTREGLDSILDTIDGMGNNSLETYALRLQAMGIEVESFPDLEDCLDDSNVEVTCDDYIHIKENKGNND